MQSEAAAHFNCDVLLVGAGIMSATVATLLKELDPNLRVEIFERLERVAGESSDAKNNAGTGHSALCELNYTSERKDGSIDISKALKVMENFEVSKQFWGWLVSQGELPPPGTFVHSVPHISFVTGAEDSAFLRKRQQALCASHLFAGMQYTDNRDTLREWMPLMMQGRDVNEACAATRSALGTDVDFGELTRGMFAHLKIARGVEPWFQHEVTHLRQSAEPDHHWTVSVRDQTLDIERTVHAKFVFIGAGGGALELLEDSAIPEGDGYGGFPVSGEWLVCKNPQIALRHSAKVYGKAKLGTPPMSVPHLDARYIEGERALLFGPFAGFSTKFLKQGSFLDLPLSITAENLLPMISAGLHNLPLTRYLISEVTKSFDERIEALREFVPEANPADWETSVAGQRVQVIKRDGDGGGKLEFGTELISAKDNTLAALLGASPGASTSVSIALELLLDCFPDQMATPLWQAKLCTMIPSFGQKLAENPALATRVRAQSHQRLQLAPPTTE